MKNFLTILTTLFIMISTSGMAQTGTATTTRKTFSRETTISKDIKAEGSVIWKLLTTASDYTRWNTTVTSLEGTIAKGETIKLKSVLDAKRTFKLKVKEFEPEKRLVWGDGKGNRIYTLTNNANGTVTFTMTEKIGGLMFPMYAKMIPSFDETFEKFVNDLEKEALVIMSTK